MSREIAMAASSANARPWRALLRELVLRICGGALLIAALYQIPVGHTVHVGTNDAAYVQGFNDPVNRWGVIDASVGATTPLRWSQERSFLVFPQIGLPAVATLRWRGLPAADGTLPTLQVLLNGRDDLGTFQATGAWQTERLPIRGGLFKPSDVFLELRTTPTTQVDAEVRGVQVDQASLATAGWPILPYPAQVLYGAVAIALATSLARSRRGQLTAALGIGLVFLLAYRLPLTSYPLRSLPPLLVVALAAVVAVRALPRLAALERRWTWPALSAATVLLWVTWLLSTQAAHTGLSVPGVERDFPVFATRATTLLCPAAGGVAAPCVLRADGFYQLGYPLLLWLGQSARLGDAFAVAKLMAAASAGLLLLATAALAWRLAPTPWRGPVSLLAVVVLALSPFAVQYGLYVGTDMPFAAAWTLGLAALLVPQRHSALTAVVAGLLCASAFLLRHPGLVLLPLGWLIVCAVSVDDDETSRLCSPRSWPWRLLGWFTLGWLVGALPQLAVNTLGTGNPLYSQQAKNIWLAVYGNTDYSGRWGDARDDITLGAIVRADPARFFANWGRNLVGFVGTGAEDTREFGQALGLRLLGAPASWLAVLGLGLWAWRGTRLVRMALLVAALYVVGVSVGFVLPRFFLPLAPIWAVAAASALLWLAEAPARRWPRLSTAQWFAVAAVLLAVLLAAGPRIGAGYVLAHQPAPSNSSLPPSGGPYAARDGIARALAIDPQ